MESPFRWAIAAVLVTLQLALGLNWMAVIPLFPALMDELTVDRATVSLLFGIVALAQAAGALSASASTTRIGHRWTLLFGSLLMASGLLTLTVSDYPWLLATRVLLGLGTGLMVPAASAIAVQWLRPGELVIFNTLGIVAMNVGNGLGLSIPVPLSLALGWRGALAACAMISALGAAAWLALGRDFPTRQRHERANVAEAVRLPETWWLAAAFAGPIAYFDAVIAWLPTYYTEVFGRDLAGAAAMTGLVGLAAVPAALAGAACCQRGSGGDGRCWRPQEHSWVCPEWERILWTPLASMRWRSCCWAF